MGKAVVSSRGQPYFVNIDEVDSFLQLFPANEKLETDILKEIMIRAIRPHAGLRNRNITYTDSLKVINKDTGEAVTERESAEIVRRLEEWDYNDKDYLRSMQLRVKQREELCVTKKKFAMANIQSKALKDGEPIILCIY